MYKIDDEFRPPGRVFMKATRESPGTALVPRGSAITTNLDERGISGGVKFRHDVIHEKTIEAVITDYRNGDSRSSTGRDAVDGSNALTYSMPTRDGRSTTDLQQITRNKKMSTEVLGSTMETTKMSQRAPDGHRRHVTHVVRKVTTLSRAEEREQANNMIKFSNDKRTIELGYSATQALANKRVKVELIREPRCWLKHAYARSFPLRKAFFGFQCHRDETKSFFFVFGVDRSTHEKCFVDV